MIGRETRVMFKVGDRVGFSITNHVFGCTCLVLPPPSLERCLLLLPVSSWAMSWVLSSLTECRTTASPHGSNDAVLGVIMI